MGRGARARAPDGPNHRRARRIPSLPPGVTVTGKWGSYRSTYAQDGATLHVVRRIEGARGVYPPEAVGDLVAWLRAIGQDDVPYLVIEPESHP